MRIGVSFIDRVGIAYEILAVLAREGLNVAAVEVEPPQVFIDVPELEAAALPALAAAMRAVPGVRHLRPVDMLPGARRSRHLDTLLAAMDDPVLALDGSGAVVVANAAAAQVAGMTEAELAGATLGALLGDRELDAELAAAGFRLPQREVSLRGRPFMLDIRPVEEGASARQAVGAVVTLHAPHRIGQRIDAVQHAPTGFDGILGDSPAMRALLARAARAAAVEAPLLIVGETGTGKELIAQACHRASRRAERAFLALNCAAIPESLAESELFGYAPGAFSGAQRGGKPGLLELADGGTVFLDEIGEMSPYLQAKLLRFLSDGTFRRVGGEREQRVDVRVVSATHRDLERMVAEGRFREDLMYRLNVLTLQVPPLRARPEDILPLARHFADRACVQTGRSRCRLAPAAEAALLGSDWPGNVRQLANVVFRAVTLAGGPVLDAADLELAGADVAIAAPTEEAASWAEAVADFEAGLLRRLHPLYPSSRKLAARLQTSHAMIAQRLRRYGIGGR
ncbi:MAG TPA: sigma 54-interacting transcriptional regulator [Alphaproteobacteria bacterium]|nr:sigma 54-interacting transcriptional regulator [Alphaproteobacteria bacterium]